MKQRPPGLLVLHPRAKRHKLCDAIIQSLAQQHELRVEPSAYPGHTRELAREHLSDLQGVFFTAGGDGTLHEAINGWADAGFPEGSHFCPLPLGTGNDFLYSIDRRLSRSQTFLNSTEWHHRLADLGRVGFRLDGQSKSCYFCVGATTGFSAQVTERRNQIASSVPGQVSYLYALLMTFSRWKNRRLRVDSPEHPVESDIFLNFNAANVRHYGGGMVSAPQACPFAGCLHAVSMNLTVAQSIKALPENFKGRFERIKNVSQLTMTKPFVVHCYPDCPVQADGELLGHTPMEIECFPGKLPLLLPNLTGVHTHNAHL